MSHFLQKEHTPMNTAFIIDAVRTPRGRGKIGKGALAGVHPQELFAQTLNELARRSSLIKKDVDDVIVGCVSQIKEQGANLARNAILAADWPYEVTGVTLNRFCGSGLQAAQFAAMGILSGTQHLTIGGGVESMSHYGLGADGGGQDGENLRLRKRIFQVPQGISADLIGTVEGIGRKEVDAFAYLSQQNAALAQKENRFHRSLFEFKDPETGAVLLAVDEFPRPGTTLETLANLPPAFSGMGKQVVGEKGETLNEIALQRYPQAKAIQHIHTAGNSSGIVDGAAAVLFASGEYIKSHSLKPRAKIRAITTCGSEPIIMLTAPAPASLKALKQAKMQVKDIDLWEINEAFAVVPLQTAKQLNIDPSKINVNGGAIALGHPLGATGAMLLGTVLDELERRNLSTALITLCIGGGQAVATIIERV
jgi:acetyl-CoA C-acetyltransferase